MTTRPVVGRSPAWRVFLASLFVSSLGIASDSPAAGAPTFRCTADGTTTYSDVPCATGVQHSVDLHDPRVAPADRAAAEERARADRASIAAIDRRHAVEAADDRRAAAFAARRQGPRDRQARACDKLVKAARRAHDDFALAGPRDQPRAAIRMRRADEDAAACRPLR